MPPGKTRSSSTAKSSVETDEIAEFLQTIDDENVESVLKAIASGNMNAKLSKVTT
jgi:hypothetical protein